MGVYVKTGPFANGGAPGISASFLNNVENVFVQPSGGTESGQYWFESGTNASGWTIGGWVNILNRTTAPVSVSFDTSITAPSSSCGTVAVQNAHASGFFIGAPATGVSNTARAGGLWTVQF